LQLTLQAAVRPPVVGQDGARAALPVIASPLGGLVGRGYLSAESIYGPGRRETSSSHLAWSPSIWPPGRGSARAGGSA
jgi:hypothetical protein